MIVLVPAVVVGDDGVVVTLLVTVVMVVFGFAVVTMIVVVSPAIFSIIAVGVDSVVLFVSIEYWGKA